MRPDLLPRKTQLGVPEPTPFKRFMLYVGPVATTLALGLGASEVILYPHLTARFGTGWIGMMVLALFFQTVWAQELARWTIISTEHAGALGSRILGRFCSVIFITSFMFIAFMIPAWATIAGSALWELCGFPRGIEFGTLFWAMLSFILIFLAILLSKVARRCIENLALWTMIFAWVILFMAAFVAIEPESLQRMGRALLCWQIPREMDWWVLGSTLAWVGAGPTLLWYTYWMKDAGWATAGHLQPIPGGMGKETRILREGFLPEFSPENINCLRVWINRSHLVLWVGYFLGSLLTIAIFVGLSDSILRPAGLVPKGYELIRHQAQFFTKPLGSLGKLLFLGMAWLFFFNTQIAISEAVVRQNAECTLSILGRGNIKRIYLLWWGVFLFISSLLILLQYLLPGVNPFGYVTSAAMLSFVSLLASMLAMLLGGLLLYKGLPKKIAPHPFWRLTLFAGFAFHLYWITRAVIYFLGR
jgi:hypothetical protein